MTFLHSGDLGDLVYSLPIIRQLGGGSLYLTSRTGTREPITPERYVFIKPLIEAQPYITRCEMHRGQSIAHDFTEFRDYRSVPKTHTLTERQRMHVCPAVPVDIETPWLTAYGKPHGRIVMARSPRYHNKEWDQVWPRALALRTDSIFIGLPEEHREFESKFGRIEYQPCASARHLCDIISGSEMFIGNQSFPFSICEGLKHAGVLEVKEDSPDCLFNRPNVHHVWDATQWPFGAMMSQCQP